MSGVEIAGFVLGAFPLVFLAFDKYKEGCQGLRGWFKFKWTLSNYIRAIERQELFLRQNLEELLSPIVDSQEELDELCNNPRSDAWADEALDKALQKYLADSYAVYLDTIKEMQATMRKILKILGVEDNNTAWMSAEPNWKDHYKRIKFCVEKKKAEQWAAQLASDNDVISKLLRNTSTLRPLRQTRKSYVVALLQRVRTAALHLHQTLSSGWQCQCPEAHTASLLLEDRPDNPVTRKGGGREVDSIKFQVLFLSNKYESTTKSQLWRETSIIPQDIHMSALGADKTTRKHHDTLAHLAEIRNEAISMKARGAASVTVKQVGFQTPSAIPPSNVITTAQITDLCEALANAEKEPDSGLIQHEDGHKYLLTHKRTAANMQSMAALGEILRGGGGNSAIANGKMSRRDRMRLAAIAASSVLQLYGTPWLESHLGKEDLRLQMSNTGGGAFESRPFVEQKFQPIARRNSKAVALPAFSSAYTREIMLRLAIVLLELCFGEALEAQPRRKMYFGPDGRPNDMTDRMIALKWQQDVLGEAGEAYSEAVSRCIDCRFGLVTLNLDDVELRQSVYDNVVIPLREVANVFG